MKRVKKEKNSLVFDSQNVFDVRKRLETNLADDFFSEQKRKQKRKKKRKKKQSNRCAKRGVLRFPMKLGAVFFHPNQSLKSHSFINPLFALNVFISFLSLGCFFFHNSRAHHQF